MHSSLTNIPNRSFHSCEVLQGELVTLDLYTGVGLTGASRLDRSWGVGDCFHFEVGARRDGLALACGWCGVVWAGGEAAVLVPLGAGVAKVGQRFILNCLRGKEGSL